MHESPFGCPLPYILAGDADVVAVCGPQNQSTPLSVAALSGFEEAVNVLAVAGANIEAKNEVSASSERDVTLEHTTALRSGETGMIVCTVKYGVCHILITSYLERWSLITLLRHRDPVSNLCHLLPTQNRFFFTGQPFKGFMVENVGC